MRITKLSKRFNAIKSPQVVHVQVMVLLRTKAQELRASIEWHPLFSTFPKCYTLCSC